MCNLSDAPTIFHITHYKAGSQWIYRILRDCTPQLVIPAKASAAHFLDQPIQRGKVYPTVFVTQEQFESVNIPDTHWHSFIIIRDLRDTLISAYFSLKVSHPYASHNVKVRDKLNSESLTDGLLFLLDRWLPACANIQQSWLQSGEELIHYEDLLSNDLEILEKILIDDCQLPCDHLKLRKAILSNRFQSITKGRPRGQEDITSHYRKGIHGDWKNYFNDALKDAFKSRYQDLLVKTGYEKDVDW